MKKSFVLKGDNLKGLSNRILLYQRTGEGYRELLKDASMIVYRYPQKKYGWTGDECSEFYLFFYRRLSRMFTRYHDMGKSFESYLYSVIKWQVRIFIKKNMEIKKRWKYAYRKEFWIPEEILQEECENDFTQFFELDGYGRIKKNIKRRGYLLYILKYSSLATEKDIDRASRLTGYKKDRLEMLIERVRRSLQDKQDKLKILRTRRNKAFYKLKLLEEGLKNCKDSGTIQYLENRMEKVKKTLLNAQGNISKIKLSPSNRELAEILGIPKGTADTSLHSLKKSVDNFYRLKDKRWA